MARKRGKKNAVCAKLERGNGSIAGMHMLLPVETALVEVKILGINFAGYARNGVCVTVEPKHGAGSLSVDVGNLVDDTEAARSLYFRKAEAAEFMRNNTPRNSNE